MKTHSVASEDERNGGECLGCALPLPLNEQSLCAECAAKLERDLIRARAWDDSSASMLPPERQEALREQVIRDYGAANELLVTPKPTRKNKRSHSNNTKRKRTIAAAAIREYTTEDVLQAAQDFIHAQGDEWVNFSRVSQHLYERFYPLKPKHLGLPGKKYKSLLKFIADDLDRFALRSQPDGRDVWWIKLTKPVTD